jgi:predicted secreted Zn-dependent protease
MKHWLGFFIFFSCSFSVAAPLIRQSELAYQIHGATAEEMREQMNQIGPIVQGKKFDADTEWQLKWHFDYQPDDKFCVVTGEEVVLSLVYHLPFWLNEKEAQAGLQKKWNYYLRNLRIHEKGHAKNGENAAAEVEAMLKNLAPMVNCQLLEQMAHERAQQIIEARHAWDRAYDQETQHGALQGAIFP